MIYLRQATRRLLQSRLFTCVTTITLALVIGANTEIFSVVNTLILQPPPFPQSDRLIRIFRTTPRTESSGISFPNFEDLQKQCTSVLSISAYEVWSFNLGEPNSPATLVEGLLATADICQTLQVKPIIGRSFSREEQQPGHNKVILLSDAFWRKRFGARANLLGEEIHFFYHALSMYSTQNWGPSWRLLFCFSDQACFCLDYSYNHDNPHMTYMLYLASCR